MTDIRKILAHNAVQGIIRLADRFEGGMWALVSVTPTSGDAVDLLYDVNGQQLLVTVAPIDEKPRRDLRIRVDELFDRINEMEHERAKLMKVIDHHFPGTVCWKSNCPMSNRILAPHLIDEFHYPKASPDA